MGISPSGFNEEAHRRYVEAGGCPYVLNKTWCNGRNNDLHQDHYALLFYPGITVTKTKLFGAKKIKYKGE